MKTERHEREGHGAVLTICRARRSHPRSPTLVCHPTNSLSAGRVTRDESSTCVDTTCTRLARARIREIIIILTGRYLSRRNRNTLSFLPFFLSCPLIPARAPSPPDFSKIRGGRSKIEDLGFEYTWIEFTTRFEDSRNKLLKLFCASIQLILFQSL